jgi:KRAB domain-containing zinc finger protein
MTTLAEEKSHPEQDMARLKKKKRTKRKKTKKKIYSCYFCSKIFYQFFNLNSHMRVHTMETPFKCQLCTQMFKRKDSLNFHNISVHTKKYPFKCCKCGLGFATNTELRNHGSVHTREKRHFCKTCSYSSFYKNDVVRHQLRLHDKTEESWKCVKCSKLFRMKELLRRHQKYC